MGTKSFLAAIVCLFFSCSPSAVSGLVVAVGVWKTVEACIRRALPHVSKKHFEVIPAFAKFYTSAAISFPCAIGWISATPSRMSPASIFWTSMRLAMRATITRFTFTGCGMSQQNFAIQAAATLRRAFSFRGILISAKIAPFNYGFNAAIAKANPFRSLWNNGEMPAKYH